MNFKAGSFLEKLAPIMLLAIVVMAFGMGIMWQKIDSIGKVAGTSTTAQQAVAPTPIPVTMDQVKDIWNKDVIKFGKNDNKLLLVEVADPSCPYCAIASGKNPELNKSAGSQFTVVADGGSYIPPVEEMRKLIDAGKASYAYVYYPGHGNGEMGMKALYCANEQDKFWAAHDLVMNSKGYDLLNNTIKNDKTKSQEMADFLKSVVDAGKLKACLDSGKYDQTLLDDTALGQSLGVAGTPGFFVNTTKFDGAYSWNDMKPAADSALN